MESGSHEYRLGKSMLGIIKTMADKRKKKSERCNAGEEDNFEVQDLVRAIATPLAMESHALPPKILDNDARRVAPSSAS